MRKYLHLARRALRRPPGFVARRALQELRVEADRYLAPRRARSFDVSQLLARTGASTLPGLWEHLATLPFVSPVERIATAAYEATCPGDAERILGAAARAAAHRVNLLGSGDVDLGADINWSRDFKSGFVWPLQYSRDIDFMTPVQSRDVKYPWELSRLQWAIPLGQAYLLTGDERHAAAARDLIESWIRGNPYAGSVNWSCAMEAAIRILTWTWLFHAFARTAAWTDEGFRGRFLVSLYLHADFVDRHFEFSDINGNHTDADAAGLVFAGLFFGDAGEPGRWHERGWRVLTEEILLQVSEDGVDFEGSVPYHRLVSELFLLPALYRTRRGLTVPDSYRQRMLAMARFTEAYTRSDGSAPCWGDADDGRALPFGGQGINDHRYLLGFLGVAFSDTATTEAFSGDKAECIWLLGAQKAKFPQTRIGSTSSKSSVIFKSGGYAVLRNNEDHVFVDCGPVGMSGRGGHGHNDVLSCELVLKGCHLATDCGTYVYTGSFDERNLFRSTTSHNTPMIDGEEINRFVHPQELWLLRNDARTTIRSFSRSTTLDILTVAHSAYSRLRHPLIAIRTFTLNHAEHSLTICDSFDGLGSYRIEVPLHLAPNVEVQYQNDQIILRAGNALFTIRSLSGNDWSMKVAKVRASASYGTLANILRMAWLREGPPKPLIVRLAPVN